MVFLLSLALAEKPGSALKSAQQSPFALNRANQTLLPITEALRFDLSNEFLFERSNAILHDVGLHDLLRIDIGVLRKVLDDGITKSVTK